MGLIKDIDGVVIGWEPDDKPIKNLDQITINELIQKSLSLLNSNKQPAENSSAETIPENILDLKTIYNTRWVNYLSELSKIKNRINIKKAKKYFDDYFEEDLTKYSQNLIQNLIQNHLDLFNLQLNLIDKFRLDRKTISSTAETDINQMKKSLSKPSIPASKQSGKKSSKLLQDISTPSKVSDTMVIPEGRINWIGKYSFTDYPDDMGNYKKGGTINKLKKEETVWDYLQKDVKKEKKENKANKDSIRQYLKFIKTLN